MTQAMERREGADAPDVNGTHRSSSNALIDFWRSAVGKKWVMALSGIGLMGFVFAHMFGNRSQESDDVMLHFALDLVDALDFELAAFPDGLGRILGHDTEFGERVHRAVGHVGARWMLG